MSRLGDRDVASRSPPNAWEGHFLIGIFPRESPLRFCKVHVFSGGRPGRHCLSAVEALDGEPQRAVLFGTADRVDVDLRNERSVRANDRWDVRTEHLAWTGDPRTETRLEIASPELAATTTGGDVLWWAKLPRVLSYAGVFGPLRVRTKHGESTGLGIVEHAWGADTRVDVLRVSPKSWHWDVLATSDRSAMAGLAIGALGKLVGARSGGRVPGDPFATGRTMQVRIAAWKNEEGRPVPARWSGTIRTSAGTLRYEARAATPVVPMVPGGGFLGTSWEGEWRPEGGASRALEGTGFTEYRAE